MLGSLLFLYACEYSKSALLADRWLEVAGAGLFLAVGIGLAWFEIKVTDFREYIGDEADIPAEPVAARSTHASVRRGASGIRSEYAEDRAERAATRMGHRVTRRDDRAPTGESVAARIRAAGRKASGLGPESWWKPGRSGAGRDEARSGRSETHEFLVESEGWSMRAKLGRSGDLLFHGHDRGGTYPAYEWMWIFHPDTFPAIRDALGDPEGEILDLLEDVVPQLDRHGRHDPGAWLRAHDIPATYREKGVSATQDTREIPLLVPGLPRLVPERRHDPAPHWPQRAPEPPSRRSRSRADEVEEPYPQEAEPPARRSRRSAAASAATQAAWTARDRADEPAQPTWDAEPRTPQSHNRTHDAMPGRSREPEAPARQSRNRAEHSAAAPSAWGAEPPSWPTRDRGYEPASAQSAWTSEASARRAHSRADESAWEDSARRPHHHADEPASTEESEPAAWTARDGRYEPASAQSARGPEASAPRSRGRADEPASTRSVWEVEPESVVYEEPRWRARGRSQAESGPAWARRDEHGYGQDGGESYEDPRGHVQPAGARPSYAEPDYQQDAADRYEEPRRAPRPEVPRRAPLSARRPPPGAEALGRGPAPVWSERPGRQRNEDSEPWPEQQAEEYRAPSRRRRYVAPPNSTEAPRRTTSYGARPRQP
ncbi:hypothetical protein AW168_06205 [Nocardia brasiliensis]|uniref:Uncharacterized protein n=1 Tax=Nocardia brasiliensis (strain ATCC 700358 / HUJEG-1) TaxID=1133849 RepID=K0F3C2_NOCB7|nr:hypothetical protein O3I_031315 [Nocardia brasiliensis ATCC 700358]OCF91364.1 hypothetical protein AW168_06205 [Nocardia brasiliensis]